jgi:hypothetical protein
MSDACVEQEKEFINLIIEKIKNKEMQFCGKYNVWFECCGHPGVAVYVERKQSGWRCCIFTSFDLYKIWANNECDGVKNTTYYISCSELGEFLNGLQKEIDVNEARLKAEKDRELIEQSKNDQLYLINTILRIAKKDEDYTS